MRGLTDRDGTALPDALAAHGVELDRMGESGARLDGALAYLELHIEQGPVLEQLDLPLGAVLGTFGVERHRVTLHRRARARRREPDAPAPRRVPRRGAQRARLPRRRRGARRRARDDRDRARRRPGSSPRSTAPRELSLDQRALDADVLADMLATAKEAAARIAEEEGCEVAWERIWEIEPIPFDDGADRPRRRRRSARWPGASHRLPSGPLHDAAEMARRIPTVMVFVKSLGGVSHTKDEDTPDEDLELSVRALDALTRRTLEWAEGRTMSTHDVIADSHLSQQGPRADRARAAHVGHLPPRGAVGRACRSSSRRTRSPPA